MDERTETGKDWQTTNKNKIVENHDWTRPKGTWHKRSQISINFIHSIILNSA